MKEKTSISRTELWIGIITVVIMILGLAATSITGYGDLKGQLGSMTSSIEDLKTSQQNEITLVNGLILKPSQRASANSFISLTEK